MLDISEPKVFSIFIAKISFTTEKYWRNMHTQNSYANEVGISTSSNLLDGVSFILFLTDIKESKYCRKSIEEHLVQWAEWISINCSLTVWLVSMRGCFISFKWSRLLVIYTSKVFIALLMKRDNYANIHACMVWRWGKGKKRETLQCKSRLESTYIIFLKALMSSFMSINLPATESKDLWFKWPNIHS